MPDKMNPITKDIIEAGGETFFKGVKALGAITVAFFILLAALIYALYYTVSRASAQDAQLTRIELKVDGAILEAKNERAINAYFLREICISLQTTEEGKRRCNPPPSLLTPSL